MNAPFPFPPFNASKPPSRGRPFTGLEDSATFMAKMQPPEYQVDGMLERGMLYTFTGNTGHGKTIISLNLAYGVAHSGLFGWRTVEPGSVLFLAGENAENVRRQWYGHCRHHGIDPSTLPVTWHDGAFEIGAWLDALREQAMGIADLRLVVADTLQAFFAGDDPNANKQMLDAAREFRALTVLPGRPTVLVPAHPVKRAARDNLVPYGGGALLNEVDGNLSVWANDGLASVHWHGKHRGADFEPLDFQLTRIEPEGLLDAKGRQMPATIALPLTLHDQAKQEEARENLETAALRRISTEPEISVRHLGEVLGVSKTKAAKVRTDLVQRRWIAPHGRGFKLTDSGRAAL